MASKPFAVIAGVGGGTGASVARKFALAYPVALLARNPDNYGPLVQEINASGGKAVGISTDVADAASVKKAFGQITTEFGDGLAAAVYNVGGKFVRKPFLDLSYEEFEAGWDANGRGAYNFSQQVLPLLAKSPESRTHPPTLIFTGATASVKANASMASFATGKWALRALSQSLAKEFGPQGVHVSHAIIDGVIDVPHTKGWEVGGGKPDAKISSEAIADSYWHLHTQPRSTLTWEVDIRPWVEKW
ncbi:MAG: hypothetical protein M1833_000957 [Piccolia ochrophora]|nr:MAG: hypothetical protein M1833_000957 [Piccolia ochrophora]